MKLEREADIYIDGQGYILARRDQLGQGGRSWRATSIGATTTRETDPGRGGLPPTVRFVLTWDNLTSGYGEDADRHRHRYHTSEAFDLRFGDGWRPGPALTTIAVGAGTTIRKFCEYKATVFFISNQYCYRINSDLTVSLEKDFGAGKVAYDLAVFDGKLIVAMGWSEGIWTRDDAGTWTQATGVNLGHLAVVNNRLWASVGVATVKNCASDPTVSTNWSAAYTVGESTSQITALAVYHDLLIVGKTDGPYALDSSGYGVPLVQELQTTPYSTNCMGMYVWHGMLFVPHRRGLYVILNRGDGGFAIQSATPGADDYVSHQHGQVLAIAGDDKWLYVAVRNVANNMFILAGREARGDEAVLGPMVWHPIQSFGTSTAVCRAMLVSGPYTYPYLFVGKGADIAYMMLPRDQSNPRYDNTYPYANTGSMALPRADGDSPDTPKIFQAVVVEADGLGANTYLDVYVSIDGQTPQLVGRATQSPRHIIPLGGREGLHGYSIQVSLVFTSPGGPGVTFLIRRVTVIGIERPAQLRIIEAVVRCADNLPTRKGRPMRISGAELQAKLHALAEEARAVTVIDMLGQEYNMIVLAPVEAEEAQDEAGLKPEILARVRMAEVPYEATPPLVLEYFVIGVSCWDTDRHVLRT